jgi:pimeloyl-ACP methyl ester carboxylesterase
VHVDEHTIDLDGSPIYYRVAEPAGEVPALYLHGIPTSSDDWIEFLATTGGIAPDLAGFGRSGKGGHLDFSVDGLTDFVEDLLSYLGVDEVRVVGHDWGAAVGLKLARRRPQRVRKLVVINAPPLVEGFEWPLLPRLWRGRWVGELVMGSTSKWMLARMLRQGCVRPDAWSRARIDAIWSQFDQGTQRAILRLVRSAQDNMVGGGGPHAVGGRETPRANDDPETPRADPGSPAGERPATPIELLWSEADPWCPPALGDAYAARLPGARIERIAGAGHWPWLDRPEVVERVAALLGGDSRPN